jgi:hypothetical protein
MTKGFRTRTILLVIMVTCSALLLWVAAPRSNSGTRPENAAAKSTRLDEATIIVEVNATDGDAGLQVFLDGDPWRSMTISRPDGQPILDIDAKAQLKGYGLTELFPRAASRRSKSSLSGSSSGSSQRAGTKWSGQPSRERV